MALLECLYFHRAVFFFRFTLGVFVGIELLHPAGYFVVYCLNIDRSSFLGGLAAALRHNLPS